MKKLITVSKEFRFAAAHKLEDSNLSAEENRSVYGECNFLHGHDYLLVVTVFSIRLADELKNGMVINFRDLKKVVEDVILSKVDHRYLNEVSMLQEDVTTCEKMAKVFWDVLEERLGQEYGVALKKLELWETPTCKATIERDEGRIPGVL